jgi:hypothetical protein
VSCCQRPEPHPLAVRLDEQAGAQFVDDAGWFDRVAEIERGSVAGVEEDLLARLAGLKLAADAAVGNQPILHVRRVGRPTRLRSFEVLPGRRLRGRRRCEGR